MNKTRLLELARALLAELEAAPASIPAAPARAEPARPAGGDGWQRCLATFWSSEMKDTPKGQKLRGRIGCMWKDEDGQQQKKFYTVFDEALVERIEQDFEKGAAIRLKLKPWKDTEIVVDYMRGPAA